MESIKSNLHNAATLKYARIICVTFFIIELFCYWEIIGWPESMIGFYGTAVSISSFLFCSMIVDSVRMRLFRFKEYLDYLFNY